MTHEPQTGKEWKAVQALGFFGLFAGVVWTCATWNEFQGNQPAVNSAMISVGSFVVLVSGELGAWWFHG